MSYSASTHLHSNHTTSSRPSRSASPSPTRTGDWVDPYAPNEAGLPLYKARSSNNPDQPMQVVDSSTARRRGGGPLVDAFSQPASSSEDDEGEQRRRAELEEDDGGKGEKSSWPVTGIGMEQQFNETIKPSGKRQFDAMGTGRKDGKWDKLLPERRQAASWVSLPLGIRVARAERAQPSPTRHAPADTPSHFLQTAVAREVASDIQPHIPLIIYTFLSLFTRLYRIGANNSVVWDEVRSLPISRRAVH